MKILVLTPGIFDKGGISRYGRFQIRALREGFGGDAPHVVSLLGRRAGDFEEPFDVSWCGAYPLSRVTRLHFVVAAWRLGARIRPDAVLSQHLNLGPLGLCISRGVGARFVENIYGSEVWTNRRRHRRAAARAADLVIADCHNSADRAVELGLVRRRPEVIWDCVDLDRYSPGPPDPAVLSRYGLLPSGRFRLLFLGRIDAATRYKGTDRLLRLVADHLSDRFEVVFAGKGDDLEHLRGLARDLGLAERTAWTGPVREADMAHVYRSADAFFLVSETGPDMGEGIPLTPLEALACGVPVIVGDQDGSRETLDGAGGACLAPTDLAGQAAYLSRLQGDPAFHREERVAARRRAETAFGYSDFARKTREALGAALAAAGGGRRR